MKRRWLAGMLLVLPAALGACGGGNTNPGGSNSSNSSCPQPSTSGSGNGVTVNLGSKDFDEELILANMTKEVLQAHGFTVNYSFMAADKAIGTALQSGTIDMYWQYTGTELEEYLGLAPGSFPQGLTAAFNYVAQKDAPRGLCWYADTPMDDTNAIAILPSNAGTYGTTLGQFGQYLTQHPSQLSQVCLEGEFLTREDGLPGLVNNYGWPNNPSAYHSIGTNTADKSIANGQCIAGEVYSTETFLGLQILQDPKNTLPPDNLGLVIRQSVAKQYPLIAGLMDPVAARLTTSVVESLNKEVDVEGQQPADVAHTWLVQNGFLSS